MQLLADDRAVGGSVPIPPPRRAGRGGWRRAPVLIGRVILWTAIFLMLARSGWGLATDLRAVPEEPAPVEAAVPVMSTAALGGFAARFVHDYLHYDASEPGERATRLAAYVPGGSETQMGWDGIGEQTVETVIPLGVDASTGDGAVVTVAALVDDGRWLQLLVPVHSDDAGRLAVTAPPSFVAFSPPAALPEATEVIDSELSRTLEPVLEAFFRAYADGGPEDLAYFVPVGRTIRGLRDLVSLEELTEVRIQEGDAARTGEATVRWRDRTTGAALVQRYQLDLVQEGGRWYVTSVGSAAAGQGGTP